MLGRIRVVKLDGRAWENDATFVLGPLGAAELEGSRLFPTAESDVRFAPRNEELVPFARMVAGSIAGVV